MRRREFLGAVTASWVVGAANGKALSAAGAQANAAPPARKGRIKQGVTRGVFGRGANFEDSCREAARLGIKGFDLTGPDDWPTLKKYGLVPSMYSGAGGTIANALNRKENHEKLLADMNAAIDRAAANGVPNIITFSGNRNGMADAEGADNCVAFLNQVKAHAEDKQITICMEYLNSKVNHKDYMFDHFAWGVDVMKRVNSPRVKILYDIYHAQIMDGDIVRNIRDNFQWIGHFHTGFVSHEYSPSTGNDPIATLEKAIQICDV
jgi:hydroxypyruvate isomerase